MAIFNSFLYVYQRISLNPWESRSHPGAVASKGLAIGSPGRSAAAVAGASAEGHSGVADDISALKNKGVQYK